MIKNSLSYVKAYNFAIRVVRANQFLQNEKKEIKALGIVGYKDIPHYCYPKLSYVYLTLTNLNWFRKPTGEKLADFVKKDFDILINFDTTSDLTLQYIAALSRAKCKVGVFNEKHKDIYDMMLNVDADYPFKELSEQYLTYINMFSQQK